MHRIIRSKTPGLELLCGALSTYAVLATSAAYAQAPTAADQAAPAPPAAPPQVHTSPTGTPNSLTLPQVVIEPPKKTVAKPEPTLQKSAVNASSSRPKPAPAKPKKSAVKAKPQQQPQAQPPVQSAEESENEGFDPIKGVAERGAITSSPATKTTIGTRTPVSVQENPASVSVVGPEQLTSKPVLSVAEVLRDIPGVEVADAAVAGMMRIRIRGESSQRVTILVDGQEVTDHSSYGTPILIDPSSIERIDVLRGPGAVHYGTRSVGGVINIITKRGAKKPVEVEIGGTYFSGSNGWQGWAAASGTIGALDYRISGALADHQDREVPNGQYTSTGKLDGTSFSDDNLYAHMGLTLGAAKNHYIAVKAMQHRLDAESWTDPIALTDGVTHFFNDLPQRDLRKIGLYYDGTDLSPIVKKVHFDAFYQDVKRYFINEVTQTSSFGPMWPNASTAVVSTSDDMITNYGGTGQIDFKFHRDHYTLFGVSYLQDRLQTDKTTSTASSGYPPFIPVPPFTFSAPETEAHIDTTYLFAQDTWSLTNNLKFTAALRYNFVNMALDDTTDARVSGFQGGDDEKLLKSAGLTYTGIRNTTLRAYYSEGYASPTLLQLFTVTSTGGTTLYGNPNLTAETSRNYELGARYFGQGLVVDVTAYYSPAKDYIGTVDCTAATCPAGFRTGARVSENIDTAKSHGIEWLVEYTLPGTGVTPYVTGAWTRRKFEFDTFSTWNTNTPEYSGRAGVRYQWNMAGWRAWTDLFVRASSGVKQTTEVSGVLDTDTLDSWGTLNFAFGGSTGPDDAFKFGVALNNLTNEEYRATLDELPGVGRSVQVTARVKF